jgi:hypothetical protein
MNNVSPISKASRLKEEEVHAAAEELQENGVKVSSIEVYKFLGRGSLTTITNFLKTWKQENMETTTLPALMALPEALKKSTEQLMMKLWTESQELAEHEINSQREALRQAEAAANERINEAQAFSEEQSKQIEALEAKIEELKKEKSNDHDFFLQEEKRLQKIIEGAKKSEGILETRIFQTEKQLQQAEAKIEELEAINKANRQHELNAGILEKEVNHLKITIEKLVKKNEKNDAALKEMEHKNYQLEACAESLSQTNKTIGEAMRKEKEAKMADLAEKTEWMKKAAKLEGELAAWKTIKPEIPETSRNSESKQTESLKANKSEYKQTE